MRGRAPIPDAKARGQRITPARAGKSHLGFAARVACGDHPRACGEEYMSPLNLDRIQGSPPRVRGRGDHAVPEGVVGGITPARAGKSSPPSGLATASWDHPRACGEEPRDEAADMSEVGSPPRVRGRVFRRNRATWLAGITPARAGKSRLGGFAADKCRDHPRACGEEEALQALQNSEMGSPPRVRGRVFHIGIFFIIPWITPARAGKSRAYRPFPARLGDHPRACGEELARPRQSQCTVGSPPRVRGRENLAMFGLGLYRITPARAGKSWCSLAVKPPTLDHPRACGEEFYPPISAPVQLGSPPRVRGRGHRRHREQNQVRITPARAGKSLSSRIHTHRSGDHPRACGEELWAASLDTV